MNLAQIRTEHAKGVVTNLTGDGLHLYKYQENAIKEAFRERVAGNEYLVRKVEEARAAARSEGVPEPHVGALPQECHAFISAEAEEFLALADSKVEVPTFGTMDGAGRLYVQCTNVRCGAVSPLLSLLDGTYCACGATIVPSWDRIVVHHGAHCHSTINMLNYQADIGFGEVLAARKVKRHLKDTSQGQTLSAAELAARELQAVETDEWLPLVTGPMSDHLYQRELEQRALQGQIDRDIKDHERDDSDVSFASLIRVDSTNKNSTKTVLR